ncbi:hypothetical protein [Microbulbifer sp. A4B17]|uniref:hypothetical protein n=1 Tax=Microbulbifer sp. A4B17 TaxID=359370 RepID=UPI0013005DC2|nr:hypothetical protein [Microbulbifer sp. A4B17]
MEKRQANSVAQPASQATPNLFLLLVAAASLNPKFATEIRESGDTAKRNPGT